MQENTPIEQDLAFDCQAIGVQVQRTVERAQGAVDGELLGLSLRGRTVSLESAIPSQEAVTLTLEHHGSNLALSTGGQVGRLEPTQNGNWIVNCDFNQPLPHFALESLFQGDLVEQRKHVRYRIVGDATIDWDSGPQNVTVKLQDISSGGFRMLVSEAGTIGARLYLVLRLPGRRRFVIPAVNRWQLRTAEGYAIGCQFLYDQGQYLMNAILPAIEDDDREKGALKLSQILQKLTHLPLFGRSG